MSTLPPPVPDAGPIIDEGAAELLSPPWPKMDPAAYEGLAGEAVETIAPHTEADPVALLLTFLGLFGNVVGPKPHIMAGGSGHPARLNVLLVGNTAKARKGTSLATVLPLFDRADPVWAGDRIRSGFGSGESLVEAVADADPEDPDARTRDRRLVVVEGEFARILATAARDGSVLSPIIRDAWDGRPLEAARRGHRIKATGAHVSVLAHCTCEELTRKLSATEIGNGFANRFLIAIVRRASLLPDGGEVPPEAMKRLVERTTSVATVARSLDRVNFADPSRTVWQDLYKRLAEDDPPGIIGALTARAEANTLRLAVAYALLAGTGEIAPQHVRAAEAVWRYCSDSVRYVWSGEHTGIAEADRLLEALRKAGDQGLTGSEQHRALGGHVAAEDLALARAELERRGLAETERETTGGRNRIRTRVRVLPVRTKRKKRIQPPETDLSSLSSLRSQQPKQAAGGETERQETLFPADPAKPTKVAQWTR